MAQYQLVSHNGVTTKVALTDAEIKESETRLASMKENVKKDIREERDQKLIENVDPIVTNPLRWDGLSTDKQNEWKTYRQALLDVPAQSGFPFTHTWPNKPS